MLEHVLGDILVEAGQMLAAGLGRECGSSGEAEALRVVIKNGRVVVASRSRLLRDAELGSANQPPSPRVSAVARELAPKVLALFKRRLLEPTS